MRTAEKFFIPFVFAPIFMIMTGCVTMTRRDFYLFKAGWRSIGYMEGLGEGSKNWMRSLEETERELAACKEKKEPATGGFMLVPDEHLQMSTTFYYQDNMPTVPAPGGAR